MSDLSNRMRKGTDDWGDAEALLICGADEIEKLETERDSLKQLYENKDVECDGLRSQASRFLGEAAEHRAEVERLRGVLLKYGRHLFSVGCYSKSECQCGLTEIVEALNPTTAQPSPEAEYILTHSDGRFYSGFDDGCYCWTRHKKDAMKFTLEKAQREQPFVMRATSNGVVKLETDQ